MITFMELTLTREQLEAARTRLHNNGIALAGDGGEIEYDHVRIHFSYSETAIAEDEKPNTLTIVIIKKPFYVPASTIQAEIVKWFAV